MAHIGGVRAGHLQEVEPTYMLQCGLAELSDGVQQLQYVNARVLTMDVAPDIAPEA